MVHDTIIAFLFFMAIVLGADDPPDTFSFIVTKVLALVTFCLFYVLAKARLED